MLEGGGREGRGGRVARGGYKIEQLHLLCEAESYLWFTSVRIPQVHLRQRGCRWIC